MNTKNTIRTGGILAIFLMSMVGMMGLASASLPSGAPNMQVTYVVHNDADSANSGGYWALDNYTQTVKVWDTGVQVSGAEVYQVNVTNTGIFCTFAGAKSPQMGTVEPTTGCGTMTGGFDGNLTTNSLFVAGAIADGSVINAGSTESNGVVTAGAYSGQTGWIQAFFPTATSDNFAFSNDWSWTYTLPNRNVWVNAGTGSSGDILTSQLGSGNIQATAGITQVLDTCTVSPSATGISFSGVVSGASSPTPASPYPITVQNTGNVNGELFVSGTDWYLNGYSGASKGQINVSATQWQTNLGSYANAWFSLQPTAMQQDTGASIAPSSAADLYFQLSVPATVPSGTYGQTITLATGC